MIDHSESGARDYSLSKSDQSPIHSDQLPDPPDPYEDISDPSLTPTDNTEQQDEDPSNSTVPTDQSPENILEAKSGKPPNRYSPDIGKTSKYPIANHVSEALKDPKWVQAIKEEMKGLEKNQTWTLETIPEKKDIDMDLSSDTRQDLWQKDYEETFAPVVKLNTVRVLLSLAANLDWPLHQLRKVLYGLKQSPRAWFGRFTMAMKNNGFKQCNSDHTLFLKHRKGKVTTLIIYVDDMIITGNDKQEISQLQDYLATEFEMKDLGGLKYFLELRWLDRSKTYFLSKEICLRLVDRHRNARLIIILENHHGEYPIKVLTNKERYQRLVGRLIYLSHTRSDIAYAVSVVSQFMHSPSEDHMNAVLRILRYLKSAPEKGLMFSKHGHLNIDGYSDADWAGNVTDRKSTSGYFTFVGNLVTWRSKKQNVVALSSAEAEFRGMTKGICELLWLRKLLTELGYKPTSTMNLFCDKRLL
ncbi:hypothetical protein Prudu_303S000400, partial [Prunus dulcis]